MAITVKTVYLQFFNLLTSFLIRCLIEHQIIKKLLINLIRDITTVV